MNEDTIIVPAHEENFKKMFLGESRWYAIPMDRKRVNNFKYIAIYRTAPISAITHIAEISSIELYKTQWRMYSINIKKETIKALDNPIKRDPSLPGFQSQKYCEYRKLINAKTTLDLK